MPDYSSLLDAAERLRTQLVTIAREGDNNQKAYYADRELLMDAEELKDLIPKVVRNSTNTVIVLNNLKTVASGSGSWAIRGDYVISEFASLIEYLDDKVRAANITYKY